MAAMTGQELLGVSSRTFTCLFGLELDIMHNAWVGAAMEQGGRWLKPLVWNSEHHFLKVTPSSSHYFGPPRRH